MSFPKDARLRRRSDFARIYESGYRVSGRFLVLFVMPHQSDDNSALCGRLGLTTTRRLGSAVVRNRARRLLREVYRHHRLEFSGFDTVVNVKPGAVMVRAELEQELLQLVRRARRRFQAPSADRS